MTRKEAINRLHLLDSLTDNEKFSEPIRMAIEALNPWKRLSEEKPEKEGIYAAWYAHHPDWGWVEGHWSEEDQYFGTIRIDGNIYIDEKVTHWCELMGPEEE